MMTSTKTPAAKALATAMAATLAISAAALAAGCSQPSGTSNTTNTYQSIELKDNANTQTSFKVETVSDEVVHDAQTGADVIVITIKATNTGNSDALLTDIAVVDAIQGEIPLTMSWATDHEGKQIANMTTGEFISPGDSADLKYAWVLAGYDDDVKVTFTNYWDPQSEPQTFAYKVAETEEHKAAAASAEEALAKKKEVKEGNAGALTIKVEPGWFIDQKNIFEANITDSNTLAAIELSQVMYDTTVDDEIDKAIADYKNAYGDSEPVAPETIEISGMKWTYVKIPGGQFAAFTQLADGRVMKAESRDITIESAKEAMSGLLDTSGADISTEQRATADDLKVSDGNESSSKTDE